MVLIGIYNLFAPFKTVTLPLTLQAWQTPISRLLSGPSQTFSVVITNSLNMAKSSGTVALISKRRVCTDVRSTALMQDVLVLPVYKTGQQMTALRTLSLPSALCESCASTRPHLKSFIFCQIDWEFAQGKFNESNALQIQIGTAVMENKSGSSQAAPDSPHLRCARLGLGWSKWHTVGSTDFASCWCDTRSLIAASWL